MHPVAAAMLALAAGATFAISAVVQQRAAQSVAPSGSLSFGLILRLLRNPMWLAGTATLIGGYGLQALALALGNVSLVAPLVVTELVFVLPLATRSEHRRPGRREWLGTAGVVIGVAIFLLAASPSGGHSDPSMARWVVMTLPCAAVIVAAVVTAGQGTARRASWLAVAAGVTFGLLSVFTKNLTYLIGRDGWGFVLTWQPYVLVGIGVMGFLFSQSAYQAGSLRNSLPVIDALEPTVAVLLAAAGFGERLSHGNAAIVFEAVGGALAIGGVTMVGRSPLVLSIYEPAVAEPSDRGWWGSGDASEPGPSGPL